MIPRRGGQRPGALEPPKVRAATLAGGKSGSPNYLEYVESVFRCLQLGEAGRYQSAKANWFEIIESWDSYYMTLPPGVSSAFQGHF